MIAFHSWQLLNYFHIPSSCASVPFADTATAVAEIYFSTSYLVFAHLSYAFPSLAPVRFPSVASPSSPTLSKIHPKD